MANMDHLLTPEQVGERLQVSTRTVYQWVREGRLQAHRIGRLWRISEVALAEFLRMEQERYVESGSNRMGASGTSSARGGQR
jgi:acetyl-CoA synthetase